MSFTAFFFVNRKKAILGLFLLKLPLDQFTMKAQAFELGFLSLKVSEALSVYITLLCFVSLMMDRKKNPKSLGFLDYIPPSLRIPMVFFLLIFFINIFYSSMTFYALQQFFKLITGFFVGALVAKTLDDEEDIYKLLKCMVFGTIIISILSFPTIFSGGKLNVYSTSGTYVTGGVGRYYAADSFSNAFMVNVPFILMAFSVSRNVLMKLLCVITILFVIIAVFASAIRASWLALSLTFIIWMVVKRRWKLLVGSIIFIFIIISTQFFYEPLQLAYQKIQPEIESIQKGSLDERSFNARPFTWKMYIIYFWNSPILDRLFGNDHLLSIVSEITMHDPHNDFINILIRLGIVGLIITLVLYILTTVSLFRAFLGTRDRYNWELAFTALLSLLTMMIPSLTRSGLTNPNYEWAFWSFAILAIKRFALEQNEEAFDTDEQYDNSAEIQVR